MFDAMSLFLYTMDKDGFQGSTELPDVMDISDSEP